MMMNRLQTSIMLSALFTFMPLTVSAQPHVIALLADKDSQYKIGGKMARQISVKAGEPIVLHIEARRGKTWSRDGAVHGFTLLRVKDHAKVPGWDLELKPGMQVKLLHSGKSVEVKEVGSFNPKPYVREKLEPAGRPARAGAGRT